MAAQQARIARAWKRNHGDEIFDSFGLFQKLFNGSLERFGTNSAFILLTSEAFTFVGNTALQFFFSSHHLYEMRRFFDGF
jgi:hypothetical protein